MTSPSAENPAAAKQALDSERRVQKQVDDEARSFAKPDEDNRPAMQAGAQVARPRRTEQHQVDGR